jgi:hypothetical protein
LPAQRGIMSSLILRTRGAGLSSSSAGGLRLHQHHG